MWSSNPAIFVFTNPTPGLAPLALYQHQRGSCPDVVKQFATAHAAFVSGADGDLGETFFQMTDHTEELFDVEADLGERYRYLYNAATGGIVVLRRKSATDNLAAAHRNGGQGIGMSAAPLGPWREEFSGSLDDFLATYLPCNW